jgi:HSP20 family protein
MEEKEKKLRPLHLRTDEGKIIEGSETKKTGTKEEISSKMEDVKKGASEKKEDISNQINKIKEGASEKKEDINNQINKIKEGASEKKEDIEENVGKVKKEVEEKKEKLEKDSKKEGMTPAEKILNDIIKKFQQGSGQINEAITDYTTEPKTSKMALKPLVDVLETNNTITLIADISGVKKEDIDIGISKNSVEITTMYKEEPELEDAKFTQKERSYGKTHRTIPLSTEIKVKKAKAKYKACTLTITLPKKVKDITKVNIED